jgi:hypothetical protein
MNDSLRTNVFVRYDPETIACACIYLSARKLKVSMSRDPPWYAIFGAKEDDLLDICYSIWRLYTRPKVTNFKYKQNLQMFNVLIVAAFRRALRESR